MASKSANMKGFYRQKKNTSSKKVSTKKSPIHAMTYGSDITQPPALISHGSLDVKGLSLSLPFLFEHGRPCFCLAKKRAFNNMTLFLKG